jgi:hypothetical protein
VTDLSPKRTRHRAGCGRHAEDSRIAGASVGAGAPTSHGSLPAAPRPAGPSAASRTGRGKAAGSAGPPGVDTDYGYGRLDALASYQWLAAAPDCTVSVAPSSASVSPGGGTSYTVSVAAVNGFSGDVSRSVSGVPS